MCVCVRAVLTLAIGKDRTTMATQIWIDNLLLKKFFPLFALTRFTWDERVFDDDDERGSSVNISSFIPPFPLPSWSPFKNLCPFPRLFFFKAKLKDYCVTWWNLPIGRRGYRHWTALGERPPGRWCRDATAVAPSPDCMTSPIAECYDRPLF